jgi:hypothetical protein
LIEIKYIYTLTIYHRAERFTQAMLGRVATIKFKIVDELFVIDVIKIDAFIFSCLL